VEIYSHFADSSNGIGALGFSAEAFVIQLITFILAYFVLRRYAFGPILKALKVRRDHISENVALNETLIREKAELEKKVEAALHEARAEADNIISGANDNAKSVIKDAEDKAKEKADNIVNEAKSRIVTETAIAKRKMENELVGLISDATEAIIDEKIDADKDSKLIGKYLRERQTS
jgi:F-type H+-transporting ATPase subunit b